MKPTKSAFVVLASAAMMYAGCKSHKNTTTSTATVTPPPTSETAPPPPPPTSNAAPSIDQLVQIVQSRWPDATAKTLSEGKDLFYNGACVNCHSPKKISRFREEEWPSIIDNMARKAQISDAQKDAVLKYVIAVKMSGM